MKQLIWKKTKGYLQCLIFPAILYLMFAVICLIGKYNVFFTNYTVEKIFQESVLATIVALAIAIPLSGGRWDFATGTIAVLGGIIGLNIAINLNLNVFFALLICILVCIVLALIEGILYITLRVPNMITSLGIVMIYESLTNVLFEGKGVNIFALPMEYTTNLQSIYLAPWCYIVLAIVLVGVHLLLRYTKFGADTKSLGVNSRLAINAGVKEKKNIILTYILIGALLGIAALINASKGRIEASSNLTSTTLMFASMGPVLVGLFLARYSNLPFGCFVGAIGFNVITYGLQAMGIDASIQNVLTGAIIVIIMTITTNKDLITNYVQKLSMFRRKEAK